MLSEAWALTRSRSIGVFQPLEDPASIRAGKPSEQQQRRIDRLLATTIYGTQDDVVEQIHQVLSYTRADEIMVTGNIWDPTSQQESDRLLIDAWRAVNGSSASCSTKRISLDLQLFWIAYWWQMSEAKGPESTGSRQLVQRSGPSRQRCYYPRSGQAAPLSALVSGHWLLPLAARFMGTIYSAPKPHRKTADKVKRNHLDNKNQRRQPDMTPVTAQKDPGQATDATRTTNSMRPSVKHLLRDISWKRVAWLAAGLFALTMVIIFVFELTTGRPVSSLTGGTSPDSTGTSLTGVTDPASEDTQRGPEQQQDSPETPPPTQIPSELDDDVMPDESEPTATVEPEVPLEIPQEQREEQTDQLPEQAPLQEQPAEPTQ